MTDSPEPTRREGSPEISIRRAGIEAEKILIAHLQLFDAQCGELLSNPDRFAITVSGAKPQTEAIIEEAQKTGPRLALIEKHLNQRSKEFLDRRRQASIMYPKDTEKKYVDLANDIFRNWKPEEEMKKDQLQRAREVIHKGFTSPLVAADKACDILVARGYESLGSASKTIAEHCRYILANDGNDAFDQLLAEAEKSPIAKAIAIQKVLTRMRALDVFDQQHIQTAEPDEPIRGEEIDDMILEWLDNSLPHEEEEKEHWSEKFPEDQQQLWSTFTDAFGRARALGRKTAQHLKLTF